MLGNENQLVVVIRDDRVKATNKLSVALSLFSLAMLISATVIKAAVDAVTVKIDKTVTELEKETESEGE